MNRNLILVFCFLILNGCAKVETASNENTHTNSNKTASVAPTAEKEFLLNPVTPKIKLDSKQQKMLDKSLPPNLREVLEKAEKLELLAELGKPQSESDLINFQPNVVGKIDSDNLKKMILESFYVDIATDESAANCYEPRHGLRAFYKEEKIDIEICFACAKFYVKSSLGNFEGTVRRDERKSENLFNELIINFGNIAK